ncbi:MAG: orotate phosphoribosyltransferase [Methylophilus sp.]|uniref:orotate phosphoribosyltransferase n=1 Tax=Methylophilus sp. TaxID=29541 RepID=UPI003F9EF7E4
MTAKPISADFITFSIHKQVLRFGEFKTKAGRLSPYFFNAGLFDDGESLLKLGEFYAHSILQSGLQFDMLFGPAYKGIPLVSAISIAFARMGQNLPYAYNRKEAKDHGEGGTLVGAPLKGRVLIIDDVISAGTSIRESVEMIRQAGAIPCGVSIALDRQEKGLGELSAVQEVEQTNQMPVVSIAKLADLFAYLQGNESLAQYFPAIQQYRAQYCIV